MEQFSVVIAVVAGVLTIVNLIDKIVAWVKALKQPQDDLEQRVEKIERQIEGEYKVLFADFEARFKRDLDRINEIEKSNKLTQKALLALMRHAIDGNHTDKLRAVADELNEYILNK